MFNYGDMNVHSIVLCQVSQSFTDLNIFSSVQVCTQHGNDDNSVHSTVNVK